MKKLMVSFVMFVFGFIGGICAFLKWLTKCENALYSFKRGLVDDFEFLLLGYNTIKGNTRKYRYQPYYRRRPYSGNYYTSYRDYYGDKSFEEDEEDENESNSNDN